MQRGYIEERYRCPNCQLTYSIFRHPAGKRERFHKKLLYCPSCDGEYNFSKVEEVVNL